MNNKNKFIVFGKPDIGPMEIEAVNKVMKSGWVGTGKVTSKFQEMFSSYMGGGYSLAVSSCTIGLQIALRALRIGQGNKVITTPLTFCATANSIINVGAMPLFVDVDNNGIIDKKEINKKLKMANAIMPVNYTGIDCGIRSIHYPFHPIIMDCAHSFGGFAQGTGVELAVFSFYPTKNITTVEGGMIYTTNHDLYERCKTIALNGQSSGAWDRYTTGPIQSYEVSEIGYKGNLPDILAAIGIVQMKRWPELREKRDNIWRIYSKAFGDKPYGHSKHLYTITVKNRDKIRRLFYEKGIGTGIHYEALHLQPAYKFLGYRWGEFPKAERIGNTTLSLPISTTMTENDANYVVDCANKILKNNP